MCESKYCCQIHTLECGYIAWPYRHTSDEKTFTNRNRLTQPFAFNRLLYTMMVHRHNISLIVWLGSNLIDMLLTIFDLKRFNLFNLIHVLTYAAIWIHQCQLIGWERKWIKMRHPLMLLCVLESTSFLTTSIHFTGNYVLIIFIGRNSQ